MVHMGLIYGMFDGVPTFVPKVALMTIIKVMVTIAIGHQFYQVLVLCHVPHPTPNTCTHVYMCIRCGRYSSKSSVNSFRCYEGIGRVRKSLFGVILIEKVSRLCLTTVNSLCP